LNQNTKVKQNAAKPRQKIIVVSSTTIPPQKMRHVPFILPYFRINYPSILNIHTEFLLALGSILVLFSSLYE